MMDREIENAVHALIADMTGRSGGDHWWESLDDDIKVEVMEEWQYIIRKHLKL